MQFREDVAGAKKWIGSRTAARRRRCLEETGADDEADSHSLPNDPGR
ncbi:MAG: hypothetical protein MUE87_04005 [Methanothrix sp.]|nr:hypothetical protein [Methanothrix sp.]